MTDKPIIFSADMVRALLEGRKTQTRRVLKPQPEIIRYCKDCGLSQRVGCERPDCTWGEPEPLLSSTTVPYAPGDRLWVREAFAPWENHEGLSGIDYRTTAKCNQIDRKWRPSIHMPRWASRLTLIVTDVRVERVLDISDEDAIAEGLEVRHGNDPSRYSGKYDVRHSDPTQAFADLWNSLHKPGFQFDDNPWVCALSFTVHHANIDALSEAA